MDYTVHGILQARILEWVVGSFSRGSSQSRDRAQVFHNAGRFLTVWTTREAKYSFHLNTGKQIDHITETHKSYYEKKRNKQNNIPTDNKGTLKNMPTNGWKHNLIFQSKPKNEIFPKVFWIWFKTVATAISWDSGTSSNLPRLSGNHTLTCHNQITKNQKRRENLKNKESRKRTHA